MSALGDYRSLQTAQSSQLGKECCCFNKLIEPEICMNATSTFFGINQPCLVCVYRYLQYSVLPNIFTWSLFIHPVFQQCDQIMCPLFLVMSRDVHLLVLDYPCVTGRTLRLVHNENRL